MHRAQYAADVARHAEDAGAAEVRVVTLPPGLPASWDLADPLPDGWTVDTVREHIEAAQARMFENGGRSVAAMGDGMRPSTTTPTPRRYARRHRIATNAAPMSTAIIASKPVLDAAGAAAAVVAHVPTCPGRLHCSRRPSQAVSQQTPSAHWSVEHCDGVLQAPP